MPSLSRFIDDLPVSLKVFLVSAISFAAFAACFGGALIVIDRVELARSEGYDKVFHRQEHLMAMYNYLGYDSRQGGLIHNFKNYILRGEKWSNRAGDESVYNNLGKLTNTIGLATENIRGYRELPGVTVEEMAALDDIESVLMQYEAALPVIVRMRADGAPIAKIDAAVKVSDEPAARGLDVLSRSARAYRAQTIAASEAQVAGAMNLFVAMMVAAGILTGVVVVWVVVRLMKSLHALSDGVYRLAQGDLTVKLKAAGRDEVGIISRFVDDLSRSMHHVVSQMHDAVKMAHTEMDAIEEGERDTETGLPRLRMLSERIGDLISDFVFLKKDGTLRDIRVQEAREVMADEEVITEEELARVVALSGGRGPSCDLKTFADIPESGTKEN